MTDPLSSVFAALADPTRRDLVARLTEGDATVGQLAAPYPVSVQAISKHLKVLEQAGLVTRSAEGHRSPVHLEAEVFDLMTGWIERYRPARDGEEFGFHGCFHEVRPDRIVQTFTWEGDPDGVSLQTLEFEDLGEGRTRLHAQSLVDSFESRDAWLRSGMEVGVHDGYAALDALLADGELAGTADGAGA